jgi:membrane-bound metal-dependent hydrolase YbcI (DUF457 family)
MVLRSVSFISGGSWTASFAVLAGGVIFAADAVLAAFRRLPLPLEALLDELGHGATGLLLLGVVRLGMAQPVITGTLIGAVMIDLDHVPMLLKWDQLVPAGIRPYSHSLLTVWVLALTAGLVRGQVRRFALSIAFGVMTHLLRDMADGGVPLLWPITNTIVAIPYAVYAAAVLVAACLVAWGGHMGALRAVASERKGRD